MDKLQAAYLGCVAVHLVICAVTTVTRLNGRLKGP
ncbi:hypothetical protein PS928_04335 [Pseudomonas fluorescens]|uniref:Uncharacterized protein n=1 Tax=Pseudomonas fluorescens TaxID=294 RepID=A0A5E7UZU3_PSEFL|nr:hypothetical protein PS928_04335 [Pseudomonas fluorescens]